MNSELIYDISACIVLYNNDSDIVIQTINSFFETEKNVFLTIVDNNSTNGILEILRLKFHNFNKIQLLNSGVNKGFGFGHNFGLKHSPKSKYHLVLNPDVIIHEKTLENMANYLDVQLNVGILGPKVLNPDGSLQQLNKRNPTLVDLFLRRFNFIGLQKIPWAKNRLNFYAMLDVGYDKIIEVPFLSGCFMLIRKSLLKDDVLFDPRYFMYFEDADLSRTLAKQAKIIYYPKAIITHYWARQAHSSKKFFLIFVQSAFRYFNKWGWKLI